VTGKVVVIRDNFAFRHPTLDAVKSPGYDTDWCMYVDNALLKVFFFASDFVLVHERDERNGRK
jgi:hypothetical protein